jgi:hypothetical protein
MESNMGSSIWASASANVGKSMESRIASTRNMIVSGHDVLYHAQAHQVQNRVRNPLWIQLQNQIHHCVRNMAGGRNDFRAITQIRDQVWTKTNEKISYTIALLHTTSIA